MDPASNSKMLLIGGAAVAVVVVVVGVRSLTNSATSPAEKPSTSVTKTTTDGDANSPTGSSSGGSRSSKVTRMDGGSSSKSNAPSVTRGSSGPKPSAGIGEVTSGNPGDAHGTSGTQIAGATAAQPTPTPNAAADTEEAKENARKIADLTSLFKNEKDPDARVDLADELGMIDDPAAVRRLLELAQSETDPDVKEALLQALTGLDALEEVGKEAVDSLDQTYRTSGELDVRIAAQDALGDIATADSKNALMNMYNDAQGDPSERLNAAENLLRQYTNNPQLLSQDERTKINDQLKLDFQAGTDAAFRSQAAMAMALLGRENIPFFQQAIATEQDPNVKQLLEKLSRMQYGNPPTGATPTPAQ